MVLARSPTTDARTSTRTSRLRIKLSVITQLLPVFEGHAGRLLEDHRLRDHPEKVRDDSIEVHGDVGGHPRVLAANAGAVGGARDATRVVAGAQHLVEPGVSHGRHLT